MNVLVTGGAGFIGSHLVDALIATGHEVRVLDSLVTQVHGVAERPAYLHPKAEFVLGDVRDGYAVRQALYEMDAVFHFAAAVGVGQSMYEPAEYVSVNSHGTAVLMEALARRPVGKLVVASSMSIYGEGPYGQDVMIHRTAEADSMSPLHPWPTPEDHACDLRSVYALTKYDQERLCLTLGAAYGSPTTALRFFNTYGPRQSLSNPYTGVVAIFASRLLNNKSPLVYEDGYQSRDFVSVHDVVRACMLALNPEVTGAYNVGTGHRTTVREVAYMLARLLGKDIAPTLTGTKRAGDVRHCFADITAAKNELGYDWQVSTEDGFAELVAWLKTQKAPDRVERAHRELQARGLVTPLEAPIL